MQDKRLAGALAVSITVVALAWATFGSDGDEGGAGAYALGVGISALVVALLFGRILPDAANPARAGWILGALALGLALVG